MKSTDFQEMKGIFSKYLRDSQIIIEIPGGFSLDAPKCTDFIKNLKIFRKIPIAHEIFRKNAYSP